jgi:LacI family transcriptional regulator
MSLSNESNFDEHIKEIINRKIPFVMFDKISKLANCSKVLIDDQKAAMSATQHLIDKGCKKIAHIRGPLNPQNAIDRYIGYKKTLDKNQIPYDPTLVYTCENVTFQEGLDFAKQIIEEHPDVDGVFAVTDLVAVGVLSYFNDHQVKVPQQVAVIGFSNWFMSQVLTPKLSTIDQPSHEMGVAAFRLLLEEMYAHKENQDFTPKTVILETSVIERDSSKKS